MSIRTGTFIVLGKCSAPNTRRFRIPHVWQVQLEELDRDERTIEIIWDEKGNSGKTAWAMYQDYSHRAVYIPPLKRGLDLVACVLGKRESDWYIIDTPVPLSLMMIGLVLLNN